MGGASSSEVDVGALELSGLLLVDCGQGDTKGFELVGDLSDHGSELLNVLRSGWRKLQHGNNGSAWWIAGI